MKREWTNKIRFVLDELVPPIIRDSKWFMWPFFAAAYGTLSVKEFMNFKSRAYSMGDQEYAKFYGALGNSVSRRRVTDLNEASINYMLRNVPQQAGLSVLDVGAGNGFLLTKLKDQGTWARTAGVDVAPTKALSEQFETHSGALPKLPFKDKEFDVVLCTHVIEHVVDPVASIRELIRITRTKLMVVVPRQRYYYYTLDEHLNFYPNVEPLAQIFSPAQIKVTLQDGDWVVDVDVARAENQRS
jgi:SAM-dependent methyltransferase